MGEDEIDFRPDVDETDLDRAVSASYLVLSAIPTIGPLIAEAVKQGIPNQRIDRIADMLKILERQLSDLQKEVLEQRLQTEQFRDLLEDGLWQTTRALTHERREYIASLLRSSLTSEQLSHERAKTLMSLLGELNDSELIILGWYGTGRRNEQANRYYERHEQVVNLPSIKRGASDEERDEADLRRRSHERLQNLGLIRMDYWDVPGHITALGRHLLQHIGFYSLHELE